MWNMGPCLRRAHEAVDMQAQKEEGMGAWATIDSVRREYEMALCPSEDEGRLGLCVACALVVGLLFFFRSLLVLFQEHRTCSMIRRYTLILMKHCYSSALHLNKFEIFSPTEHLPRPFAPIPGRWRVSAAQNYLVGKNLPVHHMSS